jgi:hypothetical protein
MPSHAQNLALGEDLRALPASWWPSPDGRTGNMKRLSSISVDCHQQNLLYKRADIA